MNVAGLVVSGAAALGLVLGAARRCGDAARGYRWLAVTAALWCVGVLTTQVLPGALGGAGVAPTLADLPWLIAPVPATVGVIALACGGMPRPVEGPPRIPGGAGGGVRFRTDTRVGRVAPALVDGYVVAVALLVIGWVLVFGGDARRSGVSAGTFLLALIHPLVDVAALGMLLGAATLAWRQVALPYLSLLAIGVADALGVGWRLTGGHQDVAEQAVQLLAFCLLGVAPWVPGVRSGAAAGASRRAPAVDRARRGARAAGEAAAAPGGTIFDVPETMPGTADGSGRATVVAACAVAAATVALLVGGLFGRSGPGRGLAVPHGPAAAVAGVVVGAAVLALAGRVIAMVRRSGTAVRIWRESSSSLRELADRTSDVVLVVDDAGRIRHASPTVAGYGYTPQRLAGTRLDDVIHPEDRAAATRIMQAALRRQGDAGGLDDEVGGRFACRLRAIDGTWRHVEATVVRYRLPGEPDQLLVTVRDVSDQVALRAQITHLTFHDGLTGLPNRAYIEEQARSALRRAENAGSGCAGVIFLDLDGFTAVNDSVGHSAGDLVLAQAARRLRAAVPPHDTVARWGSDEFAVLAEGAGSAQEIAAIAERMAAAVAAEPFHVADRDVALTASIGVALADGSPPGLVLRNADVAMFRAKENGGGRVEFFAAHMHADIVRRLELASELRQAVSRGELSLQYQPMVELATSRVTGAEALIRWRRGGVLAPPTEFLDVAEDSGLIVPLGDWVLETACGQAAAWRGAGWLVDVAVNLSPRQLGAPGFVERVAATLTASGLAGEALILEVAERSLLEGGDQVTGPLTELRGLGVRLAIDDFGAGHACLGYLRDLPVDIIKIDPSLVAGLGVDATGTLLTRTIVHIGRDLGIQVVAEGVEHDRQLALLREMGCGYGQGFLVGRPMTASDVATLLRAEHGDVQQVAAGADAPGAGADGRAAEETEQGRAAVANLSGLPGDPGRTRRGRKSA